MLKSFKIAVDPPTTTHQANARIMKRANGSSFIGKPHNSKGARLRRGLVNVFKRYAPAAPYDFHVEIEIVIVFPWNKSDSKKKRLEAIATQAGISDVDNHAKLYLDALTDAKFWKDDNLVTDLIIRKRKGDDDLVGIYIDIKRAEARSLGTMLKIALNTFKSVLFS